MWLARLLVLLILSLSLVARSAAAQSDICETETISSASVQSLICKTARISLQPIGQHTGPATAEIAAYDPTTRRIFSVNPDAKRIDVIDATNPAAPVTSATLPAINVASIGTPNSAAVREGILAVAVEATNRTDPGRVLFYTTAGTLLASVTVGAVPDMVAFTPNGRRLLVANEGEPNPAYTIDPEGSVSIIDLTGGAGNISQADVRTARFVDFTSVPPGVRIYGPGATIARDLEPEYLAISHDSQQAWVTLQENNAVALLDIEAGIFTAIVPLGFKDHSVPGNALDASDRDGPGNTGKINIQNWPVLGMYLPDAIDTFRIRGETYLITANEGDSRDLTPLGGTFIEEARVNAVLLDLIAFPDQTVKQNAKLGRLKVTTTLGDTDGDGDFDQLYSFGARSFSVWSSSGELLFDSGDQFEQITAKVLPAVFNDQGDGAFDSRSDDKGPEPEGVVVGHVYGRQYAFITLERIGGLFVYDLSDPRSPEFVQYITTRGTGDRAPEGVLFVKAEDSPNGRPLLILSHEISGTTRIFEVTKKK